MNRPGEANRPSYTNQPGGMDRRIRVATIVSGFAIEGPSGGLGRSGIALSRAFNREQFEPIICALWDYGTTQEAERIKNLNEEGIEAFSAARWVESAPYRSFWRSFFAMQKRLAGARLDILHSHSEFGDVAAILLKRRIGARKVARTVHNQEWVKRPLRRIYLTRLLYPLAFDIEIGVSRALVDQLNGRLIAKRLNRFAQVAPPAYDLTRFLEVKEDSNRLKQSLNIPQDAPVIGSVGRLMKQKGYSDFIRAAAIVNRHHPEAYFLLVGEGELHQDLADLTRELGITGRVVFTGMRSDVEAFYQTMDMFVSTSLWEGLPTVIIESMASHVPVIATNIMGSSELVENEVNGLLVPPQDPAATARAILELLENPEKRLVLARRADETPGKYAIEAVAVRYENIYRNILASNMKG